MTPQTQTTAPAATQTRSALYPRIVGGGVFLLALVAVGAFPHLARARAALAATQEAPATHPVVTVIHAKQGEPTSELLLPGNIQPLYSANLFARVEGYLDRRTVDIGSHVKAGQTLAVISSPEIDQQLLQARAALAQSQAALEQARAALEQAKANAELSRLNKERDLPLGEQHAISQQLVDTAVQAHQARLADVTAAAASITAAEANVTANRANVSRLQQMQGFEHILAPFDGIITARNVERGDLVATGAAAGSKPLFSIAQSDTLRIQIDVPQSEAVHIKDGQTAGVHVQERADRGAYRGTVIRNAGALDDAARTMRTEVQVNNSDGSLLPGMYAQVAFTLSQQRAALIIPASSLVIDHGGMHIVTVDAAHTVHFKPVTIGKDMGKEVEVLSGLLASETLVASPSDLLHEGEHVELR